MSDTVQSMIDIYTNLIEQNMIDRMQGKVILNEPVVNNIDHFQSLMISRAVDRMKINQPPQPNEKSCMDFKVESIHILYDRYFLCSSSVGTVLNKDSAQNYVDKTQLISREHGDKGATEVLRAVFKPQDVKGRLRKLIKDNDIALEVELYYEPMGGGCIRTLTKRITLLHISGGKKKPAIHKAKKILLKKLTPIGYTIIGTKNNVKTAVLLDQKHTARLPESAKRSI